MALRRLARTPLFALLTLSGLSACTAQVSSPSPSAPASAQTVAVQVAPATAQVAAGGAVKFASTVTGTSDTAVVWSVVEAGGGAVDATGLYTAPSGAGTYHVAATSHAAPVHQAVATVTVNSPTPTPTPTPVPVVVTISPSSPTVDACRTVSLTAAVTGTTDTAVTWSVQEGTAGGTVAADGTYTAPQAAGTYHVVATSHADPTSSSSVAIVVNEHVLSVAVTPPLVTIQANGTAQFTATVTTTCGSFAATQRVALSN